MSFIFDFLPILAFFICYKFFDIYIATAVTIFMTLLQIVYVWFRYKKIDKTLLLTFVTVIILGGATLLFHNELFIKWKPTALYWAMSSFIILKHLFGYGSALKSFLQDKILLQDSIWYNVDAAVAIFLSLLGFVNIFIAYNYDTNTWVYFKLFGALGSTLVFSILLSFYIAKNAEEIESHE
jgi:intracellular septation protein